MSTRLTYDLTYDAPLTEVGQMLLDPAFRERVCDAIGAIRKNVSVGPDIPGFARKFVGDEIEMVQTERWSDMENALIDVVIPGKPGHMTGTATLREEGGTTTETVAMEIKVNIPLVGGKIESLIADLLRKALRAENAVGRDHLAR
jgi:hypothetical protein